jgi:hypothetical protein
LNDVLLFNKQILKTNVTAFGCDICFFHFFDLLFVYQNNLYILHVVQLQIFIFSLEIHLVALVACLAAFFVH